MARKKMAQTGSQEPVALNWSKPGYNPPALPGSDVPRSFDPLGILDHCLTNISRDADGGAKLFAACMGEPDLRAVDLNGYKFTFTHAMVRLAPRLIEETGEVVYVARTNLVLDDGRIAQIDGGNAPAVLTGIVMGAGAGPWHDGITVMLSYKQYGRGKAAYIMRLLGTGDVAVTQKE